MTKIAEVVEFMSTFSNETVINEIKEALVGVFNTISNCLIVNLFLLKFT